MRWLSVSTTHLSELCVCERRNHVLQSRNQGQEVELQQEALQTRLCALCGQFYEQSPQDTDSVVSLWV